MNISVDSENRNRAALFAGEIASQMWLNATVTPATANYTALLATVNNQTQGGLPRRRRDGMPVAGTTNTADITVTWKKFQMRR